jgi:GNAT superfamily N-acetyltransferase
MILSTHLNYKSHVFAFGHAIYIAPGHRGHGLELIRLIEREMRGRGVSKIVFNAKDRTGFGAVLAALGYCGMEQAWGKLL